MKKSTFKDWTICYWVDYSFRKDCDNVEEISQEQFEIETKKEEVIIEKELTADEIKTQKKLEKELKEENRMERLEKLILRKQTLELLGKDTTEIDSKIALITTEK